MPSNIIVSTCEGTSKVSREADVLHGQIFNPTRFAGVQVVVAEKERTAMEDM